MPEPVATSTQDGVTIVEFAPQSNLDATQMESITPRLYQLMAPGDPQRVVFDFSNVAFVSSQALGAFVTVRLKGARAGKFLAICGIPDQLAEIFTLTQLDKLYNIFPDRNSAIQNLREA